MKSFLIGSRWISESEPELGLGVIIEIESKTVTCFFPAAKVENKIAINTIKIFFIIFLLVEHENNYFLF